MKIYIRGVLLTVALSIIAYFLAKFIPIGAVAIAIIIGIIVGNSIKFSKKYDKGVTFSEKSILSFSIALMGINLDFSILANLGIKSILIIIIGMVITIFSALLIGKLFKIDKKLALLLGIGNGVCGSSAISATAPIIHSNKENIGISIAIVNLLGTIGIFLLPAIALLFDLNELNSGLLIGNTLQAVGQVTAGGFSISELAGVSATTIKMGRVLLLTPIVFILIYLYSRNHKETKVETKRAKVPLFIIFFIIFSLISSFSLVSENIKEIIALISHFSLIIAMSGVGLKIHLSSIKSEGKKALIIASIVFFIQIVATLGFILI